MWPRRGFTSCEASNEGIEDRAERFRVVGRDVAAIAFIPAAAGVDQLPPCALSDAKDEELRRALDLFVQGGNPQPKRSFADAEDFLDALRAREYRGALALTRPTMFMNGDGVPVRVAFRMLDGRVGVGYVAKPDGGEPDGRDARSYVHGIGSVSDRKRNKIRFAGDAVEIVHWQRFECGSPAQLFGRFPRAQHAPFGWIKVSYVLRADARAEVHLASSFLPSVWFYRDFSREHVHDMLEMNEREVHRFLMPDKDCSSGTTWMKVDVSSGSTQSMD
jgi:hypothetical protein